jgi:intracellular multiplication protein IcmP
VFRTTAAFAARQLRPVGVSDGDLRPLDPALHAREWIDRHARTSDGAFDEGSARRELIRQLGPVWSGPQTAPPLVRCLLAAFALHASRDRDATQAFLGDFSEAMAVRGKEGPEGPARALPVPEAVTTRADTILAGRDVQPYLACADGHAFTAPALMSVLTEARQRAGVLAPAQFNFIKLVDRRLWYALHSLGFPEEEGAEHAIMPNPRIEAAGARDHWAAERMEGRPLLIPSVERAMAGIHLVAESRQRPSRRKNS